MFKKKELQKAVKKCFSNVECPNVIFIHGLENYPFNEFVDAITGGNHVTITNHGYCFDKPYFPKFFKDLQEAIGKHEYIYLRTPEAGAHIVTRHALNGFLLRHSEQKFIVFTHSPNIVYGSDDNLIDIQEFFINQEDLERYQNEFLPILNDVKTK